MAAAASIRCSSCSSCSSRRAAVTRLERFQPPSCTPQQSQRRRASSVAVPPVPQRCRSSSSTGAGLLQQQRGLATSSSSSSSSSPDAGGGFASEREYHAAADEALEEVQVLLEGMEDAVEDFEVNYSVRVLVLFGARMWDDFDWIGTRKDDEPRGLCVNGFR